MFRFAIAYLLLIFPNLTSSSHLQVSFDNRQTWHPHQAPLKNPSSPAHIRLSNTLPDVQVPSCALEGDLRVQVWRDAQGNPLGLRWHSEHCENPLPSEHHHIVINDHAVQTVHLDWLKYVRWLPSVKPAETEKPEPKSPKKGFFSKYGLLLMIFVAVALGRGIRQGLIELREEVEREQQEAEQKKKPPGQIRVVVPRKKDSKVRKRARTTQK